MVIAVLRAITWGTVAAAVTSAALLASVGGAPRIASITGDAARGRLSGRAPGQISVDASLQQPAAPGAQARPITR